jgi:hypothetical protein
VALSADDVWAVGAYGPHFAQQTLVLHRNGGEWKLVPAPSLGTEDNYLKSVAAVSADDIWAVGYDRLALSYPGRALVEHYPLERKMAFGDVHAADFYQEGVSYLYCRGVVSGYPDNTFRPTNNMTRGQASKVIVLAENWPIDTSDGQTFSDVAPGSPFYVYIQTASNRHVISGHPDGTFRPGNNISRGQFCKVLALAEAWQTEEAPTQTFADVPPDNPFYPYIEAASRKGIVSCYSDGTFRPNKPAIRAQIAKIVHEAVLARQP